MTTCDHGIRLDVWCDDCESGFLYRDDAPLPRRLSGRIAAACVVVLAVLALAVVLREVTR